jgi:hypothetical protein
MGTINKTIVLSDLIDNLSPEDAETIQVLPEYEVELEYMAGQETEIEFYDTPEDVATGITRKVNLMLPLDFVTGDGFFVFWRNLTSYLSSYMYGEGIDDALAEESRHEQVD